MGNRRIGFKPPPPARETLERKIGHLTVVYTKERKKEAIAYNCECERNGSTISTDFDGDRKELSWEEVEALPKFVELVRFATQSGLNRAVS